MFTTITVQIRDVPSKHKAKTITAMLLVFAYCTSHFIPILHHAYFTSSIMLIQLLLYTIILLP